MFELFRQETSSKGKTRIRYRINEDLSECCEKIFSLKNFGVKNVIVTIPGEEMRPFVTKRINSFQEYKEIENEEEISSCEFVGEYNETEIKICVDNELSILSIVAEKTIIQCIMECLSK